MEVPAALDPVVAIEAVAPTEDVEDHVPEEDREADRHHEHRDQARAATPERSPHTFVEEEATEPACDGGQQGTDDQRRLPAEHTRHVEQVGDHGAERDHLAVGEVGQARGAVDQRQPDRGHRDEETELGPVDGELDRPDRGAPRLDRRTVTHREQVGPGVPLVDGERQRVAVGISQDDTLGERLLTEQRGVLAGAREPETPVALGIGHGETDLGPVGCRDDELDPLEEDVFTVFAGGTQRATDLGGRCLGVAVDGGLAIVLGVRRSGESEQRADRHRGNEPEASGSRSSLSRTWSSGRRRHRAATLARTGTRGALHLVNAR